MRQPSFRVTDAGREKWMQTVTAVFHALGRLMASSRVATGDTPSQRPAVAGVDFRSMMARLKEGYCAMTDEVLMTRVASGDEQAFETLFDRHADWTFAQCRMKIRDRHRAAEAWNDAWRNVWRSAGTFGPQRDFDPWMREVVRNACIATIRMVGRWREKEAQLGPDELFPDRRLVGPLRELIAKETLQKLPQALDQLTPEERIVFVLRYLDDVSIPVIAQKLGITPGAVSTRLCRARAKLRGLLGGDA